MGYIPGRNELGVMGSVFADSANGRITPPTNKVFVAITMLADTVFDSSGGLIAERTLVSGAAATDVSTQTGDIYIGTEQPANDLATATTDEGTGGLIIGGTSEADAVTFPKGVTIYGRWTEVDVHSGAVIAYIGD